MTTRYKHLSLNQDVALKKIAQEKKKKKTLKNFLTVGLFFMSLVCCSLPGKFATPSILHFLDKNKICQPVTIKYQQIVSVAINHLHMKSLGFLLPCFNDFFNANLAIISQMEHAKIAA